MKKVALVFVITLILGQSALAQAIAPVDTAARQVFLLDANTDTPLFAKNADTQMPTSSMSKMMTIYLVFEALKFGKIHLNDKMKVSEHAWRQEGSRMFLDVGQSVGVEDLIRGTVVQSGNDAAVVLAEGLGGSEENFVEVMNARARQLGMEHSHFVNATGLPDPQHYSTASDLATLALALLHDFPEDYHYFSELDFTFNGIKQGNRNPLLYRNMDVDGLKTGHTDSGGFGLAASAIRNGRRLVLVLNGVDSMQARADESAKMFDWGYREFGDYTIVKEGERLANADLWLGQQRSVPLIAAKGLTITLPRSARDGLKAVVSYEQPIAAPVMKGQQVGVLTVTAPGLNERVVPLLAADDVPRLGFFAQMEFKLHTLFGGG